MKLDENVKKISEKLKIRKFSEENMGVLKNNKNMEESNIESNYTEMCRNLEDVNRYYYIDSYRPIKSHRKIIGKVIILYKKITRKLLKWYINPIVKDQNLYNSYNTKVLNATKCTIENLKRKTGEIHQVNDKVNQVDNKVSKVSDKINQVDSKVNDFYKKLEENNEKVIKSIKNELYVEFYRSLISKNNHDENLRIYENIISKTNDFRFIKEAIKEFESKVSVELAKEKKNKKKNIVVLCKKFREEEKIEAIKKEAYTLYTNLKNDENYNVNFVSMEEQENIEKNENGIYFISNNKVSEQIKKINPDIIHIFESNVHILFVNGCELLKYNIIFHVTGQEPFPNLPEWALDELRHLNDNNKIQFIVESKYAKGQFIKNNFKNPKVIYPLIDIENIEQKNYMQKDFTIGFASSPMSKEQMEHRGIYVLSELIKNNQDIMFRIAWRNKKIAIPEEIIKCKNVDILYGKIDMNKFYSSVDCIIIPYKSLEDNHACSLSGLEAMVRGIPVVATSISGISNVIDETNIGLVSNTSAKGLQEAALKIKENYTEYTKLESIEKLKNQFVDINTKLKVIKTMHTYFTSENVYTLKEWNEKLQENNKYLVKGNENIKNYYSQQSIATSYHEDRFSSYPMNLYDALERKAINIIINAQYGQKDLELLDIASGDGRILKELFEFGKCTSIDNSSEMLKIVFDKYAHNNGLTIKKGDFLEINVENKYDVITTFRYIRHFEYEDRKVIYEKIRKSLNDNGIFIFDVPNIDAELKLRETLGWQNFNIYDVFWSKKSIELEAEQNGFEIKFCIPVGENLIEELPHEYRIKPLSWVVGLVKK
ncbi:methyltransferase domain-containing protein [Clostridium butyricum]|uniref:methyltransferase domain-containing protein n=1 Tax=Clostridium butyricum TaxID=1492 RepID=UPI00374F6E71